MTRVVDGLRSGLELAPGPGPVTAPPAGEPTPAPATKRTVRLFGSSSRALFLELAVHRARQIGDDVIPQRIVKVRFRDGVLKLDPSEPEDAEKIALLEKHEWFGSDYLYDLAERRELAAKAEVAALAETIRATLADPSKRDRLVEIAGDSLLDILTMGEKKAAKKEPAK